AAAGTESGGARRARRVAGAESLGGMTADEVDMLVDSLVPALQRLLAHDLLEMKGQLAALETAPPGRDGRDGQAGRDGAPGPAGADGTNGLDGLGFDDLVVEHDGERAFTFKCLRGERVKVLGTFRIPAMMLRTLEDGRTYEPGDVIQQGGNLWVCLKTTVLKPSHVERDFDGNPRGSQGPNYWRLLLRGVRR